MLQQSVTPTAPWTTFAQLRASSMDRDQYLKLARALGGVAKYGQHRPIPLLRVLGVNGLDEALLALQACADVDRFDRYLACAFAAEVLPIYEHRQWGDERPRRAVDTARHFALGMASVEELRAAWEGARAAIAETRDRGAAFVAAAAGAVSLVPGARPMAGLLVNTTAWYAAKAALLSKTMAWADMQARQREILRALLRKGSAAAEAEQPSPEATTRAAGTHAH